jgi:hypothetical protein
MTALTRRHVIVGAGATMAVAALPAAAPAPRRAMYIRWDGLWPTDVHPNKVGDGDLFTDHRSNAVWRHETDSISGWVYLRKIHRNRPSRMRELTLDDLERMAAADVETDHPYNLEDIPEI